MNNLLFGPSGRSEDLIENKYELDQIPAVLCSKNLHAFEYPFTYGVKISDDKAAKLKLACDMCDVSLSVHAPYYINLANKNPDMIEKTYSYFAQCLNIMPKIGANRLVFHPGALMGMQRDEALALAKQNLKMIIERLKEQNLIGKETKLCPETMGKHGQLGTVAEVAELCKIDDCLIPTIDFGHINSFTLGGLKSTQDFVDVLKKFGKKIEDGNVHIHFSKIEYTQAGEKKHLNFCDDGEPNYKNMIDALVLLNLSGRIISESAGHQVTDSIEMMDYCNKIKK